MENKLKKKTLDAPGVIEVTQTLLWWSKSTQNDQIQILRTRTSCIAMAIIILTRSEPRKTTIKLKNHSCD